MLQEQFLARGVGSVRHSYRSPSVVNATFPNVGTKDEVPIGIEKVPKRTIAANYKS